MTQLDQIEQTAAAAEQEASRTLTAAKAFTVTTDEQYAAAGEDLKAIKTRARELEEQEKAITRPINDSLKRIRDLFRKPKDFLADAERVLKRAMLDYQAKVEEQRREEQRKAEEAARKERERIAKLAAKAAEKGQEQRAEAHLERPAAVTAPVIQREAPKVAAVATREVWKGECADLDALIQAAAGGNAQARACLMANDKVIGQQARALKDQCQIPGVRVWSEKVMAA